MNRKNLNINREHRRFKHKMSKKGMVVSIGSLLITDFYDGDGTITLDKNKDSKENG